MFDVPASACISLYAVNLNHRKYLGQQSSVREKIKRSPWLAFSHAGLL